MCEIENVTNFEFGISVSPANPRLLYPINEQRLFKRRGVNRADPAYNLLETSAQRIPLDSKRFRYNFMSL